MAKRGLETKRNQARVIRALERFNGSAQWSDLKAAGCNYASVQSCITDGYITNPAAYRYDLTRLGKHCVLELEEEARRL